MQDYDYTNIWRSYLEFYQRSWLEISRLWWQGFPQSGKATMGTMGMNQNLGDVTQNWLGLFNNPWLPKSEANIEPWMEEATRLSMQVFLPWGKDAAWVEAIVGKKDKAVEAATGSNKKALPAANKTNTSAEQEVTNAIKRSRTQD